MYSKEPINPFCLWLEIEGPIFNHSNKLLQSAKLSIKLIILFFSELLNAICKILSKPFTTELSEFALIKTRSFLKLILTHVWELQAWILFSSIQSDSLIKSNFFPRSISYISLSWPSKIEKPSRMFKRLFCILSIYPSIQSNFGYILDRWKRKFINNFFGKCFN